MTPMRLTSGHALATASVVVTPSADRNVRHTEETVRARHLDLERLVDAALCHDRQLRDGKVTRAQLFDFDPAVAVRFLAHAKLQAPASNRQADAA
jgi:hypothetical protein